MTGYYNKVFNMQRLAVLTTALAQTPPDPDLIYEAMKDRIHQPYRKTLVRFQKKTYIHHQFFFIDTRPTRSNVSDHPRHASWLAGDLSFRRRPNHSCTRDKKL